MNKNQNNKTKSFLLIYSIIIILIFGNIPIMSSTINIPQEEYNQTQLSYKNYNKILYVGGNGESNYTIIQEAIDDALDGDTIYVYDESSPYQENLIINKKINLIGEDYKTTIIDGKKKGDIINIKANNVNISGFTIKNSGNNWIDAGIKIESDNNNITKNKIIYNKDGIYSYNLENSIISNNIISNNTYYGINIPFSRNNIISDNNLINNQIYGIYLYDSLYNKIYNNTITKNNVGIYLWFSFNIEIKQNIITNNQNGIKFCHQSKRNNINENIIKINEIGIYLNITSNNNITKNTIEKNIYGMYFKDTSISNIIGNIITNNENGIYFTYSPENHISQNIFYKNKEGLTLNFSSKNDINQNSFENNINRGILIKQSSNYNTITSNNFIENNNQAYFKQSFQNEWKTNYWDNWDKKEPQRIEGEINILKNLIIINWYNIDENSVENPHII